MSLATRTSALDRRSSTPPYTRDWCFWASRMHRRVETTGDRLHRCRALRCPTKPCLPVVVTNPRTCQAVNSLFPPKRSCATLTSYLNILHIYIYIYTYCRTNSSCCQVHDLSMSITCRIFRPNMTTVAPTLVAMEVGGIDVQPQPLPHLLRRVLRGTPI